MLPYIMLLTLHYSSHMHMYILYSTSSTASLCNTCITSHFNYATLFTLSTHSSHMYILYSIPSTVCCSVPSLIHISLCTYPLSPYTVYKTVVLELLVRLLVGYHCIVGTRSTSISLHSHLTSANHVYVTNKI